MPELPEVETVCRLLRGTFKGNKIIEAEFVEDEIVFGGLSTDYLRGLVLDREVTGIGRKGKYWWFEFEESPWLFGHLGMAGWIREMGESNIRIREHGNAPLYDEEGNPRYMKWRLTSGNGREVVMTDHRRFSRVWVGENADKDPRVSKLGPDVYNDPWTADQLVKILSRRKAPLKAVLLDQKVFSGVGNWIADEVLYQARLAPKRLANTLTRSEVGDLLEALKEVVDLAVKVGADKKKFPDEWIFHTRWGGSKGEDIIGGNQIVREQVGGRTTAWVPAVQK